MSRMSRSICCEDWKVKLFGSQLVKCDTLNEDGQFQPVDTGQVIVEDQEAQENVVYGVYFSFANISADGDDFTKILAELYSELNKEKKKLEVIQVVLWTRTDVFIDHASSFRRNIIDLPWYAVPFSEIEIKRKLTYRFRIKVGAPVLVLLKSGGVEIARPPKDLLEKRDGFPWTPRPINEILCGIPLERCDGKDLDNSNGGDGADTSKSLTYDRLPEDCTRAFYFAAHWCPPCKALTPQLSETYSLIRRRGHDFQIIFVSSDRSEESFSRCSSEMPWLRIPWSYSSVRRELALALDVQGIPALRVFTSPEAQSFEARHHAAADHQGLNFPWKPGPVNILNDYFLDKLREHPAIILFVDGEESEVQFAESVLLPAAESYFEDYVLQHPGPYPYQISPEEEDIDFDYTFSEQKALPKKSKYLHFLIAIDTDTSDLIREHTNLDDAVPLLTAIDFPKGRMATMQYGDEITANSVQNFIDNYLSGQLQFKPLKPMILEDFI